MTKIYVRILPVLLAGLISLSAAQDVDAQLAWTVYGVGEFDTSDVILVLGGVSVAPARSGWVPVGGVSAAWLQYPVSSITDDTRSTFTVTPSVGIGNNFNGGAFQFRVGYAFTDSDDNLVPPVIGADVGEDGIVNIAQVDYWGSGNVGAQAIASYNYGAESLWARGRVTRRIAGPVHLGGEVALLNSPFYDATQIGGVLSYQPGRGAILNAGVGRKFTDDAEDATYFRFELVLIPR